MGYCIIISATNMGGPRITLIRPLILSDPITGMGRTGIRGINKIRITCRVLHKSIPITVGTMLVRLMTRIFIMPTIVARGKAGIRDSMASVLEPPVLTSVVDQELLLTSVVDPELLQTPVVGPELLLTSVVDPELLQTSVVDPVLLQMFVVDPVLLLTSVVDPVLSR